MTLNRAYDLACVVIGVPVFSVLVTRDPWGGIVTLALLFVLGTLLPSWLRSRMSRAAARPGQVRRLSMPTGASNQNRRQYRRGRGDLVA